MRGSSVVAVANNDGWRAAHEALTRLAKSRAALDFEEGERLRAARLMRVHERLGFGSFVEYIERLFGYSPRLTLEKLRVAESLEGLPELAEALRSGRASWSSVRELTRVATRETERAWFDAARGKTMREVERLVSGYRPGDLPSGAQHIGAERHVLRFEVCGEVLASFREALAQLRRDASEALDDDAALLLMARRVLEGPKDEGRASYQVAITVCEACGRATQAGCGEAIPVAPDVAEMACCDAQTLPQPSRGQVRAMQAIPPAIRRAVLRRDHHRCQVPGCRHATFVDVHHIRARADGGGHEPENLLTLCGAHHRACHRGDLRIDSDGSGGLRFRHADGSAYGERASAGDVEVMARALQALRSLGFSEREAREALASRGGSAHVGIGEPLQLENLIRAALALLTRSRLAKAS